MNDCILQTETNGVRTVAFYLPQFHPIPENDEWWGKGFTEWRNVSKAETLFPGHYQPRLPADVGFYDLRVPEVREAQVQLARMYCLYGFCYYHYWFGGKRLIERPFNEVLSSGEPDFPFCLCWVNESWSRRWLGEERDILIKQIYPPGDDVAHAQWLVAAFNDSRYIKIGGRPLFLIWRPLDLPEPRRTTDTIRMAAVKTGLPEPYLVGVDGHSHGVDFRLKGFDSTLNFTPQLGLLHGALTEGWDSRRLLRNARLHVLSAHLKLYDYEVAWRRMFEARPNFPHIPSVFVGWDNSPRRGQKGIIMINSTPQKFAQALRESSATVKDKPATERFVFIDAWNEWAEGNYLEPDMRYGRGYLEAVKSVVAEFATPRDGSRTSVEQQEGQRPSA